MLEIDLSGLLKVIESKALSAETIKQACVTGVGNSVKKTQAQAKLLVGSNTGELRESIKTDIDIKGGEVEGIVYTNKAHAPFVEFGTGPVGEANKPSLPEGVDVTYSQEAWWIHESQIDAGTAEKYNFFRIETKDGVFYRCSGQAAQPFMVPAARYAAEITPDEVAAAIRKGVK